MATIRCAWIGVLVFLCLSFSNAHRVLLDNNYGQGTGVGYGTRSGCVIGSGTCGNSNSAINKAIIGVGTSEDYPPPGAIIGGDDQIYRRVPPLNPPPKSENVNEPKPPDTSDELRKAYSDGGGPDPPPDCPDSEPTPPTDTSDGLRKALRKGDDPPPDVTYDGPPPDDID